MAQCKDCIHERVCVHNINIENDTYAYMGIKYDTEKCEHYMTKDVVPKSEVENLKDLNKQLEIDNFNANMNLDLVQQEIDKAKIELEAMRCSANSYKMHYENTKKKVEELEGDLVIWKQNRFNIFQSIELYDKTRAKVAREIFEEMQSCLIQRHWNGLDIVTFEFDAVKYAELKKKYTKESEGNI